MTKALDFQSIIFTLQQYWAEQGCLIWQPYYSQVGAGTMNPATFLRVLGPEPWNVAYVEPSVRPDDGRYGMNPNRLQQHYQFQVILKPDPGNPQELYLKSLVALGIDPLEHDIRFVEDNWESPALGAWGLGWEVWLDGQEITQFTYFQQGGGKPLDVVSVEITYGLERIALILQKARSFRDIKWNPARTYGDVNLAGEHEHSTYYFEVADVKNLRKMFDLYDKEAAQSLAKGLVLPAYDYLIKCSHTFNILDSRGAVGVTERQAFFAKMRNLSRNVAEMYIEQRKQLEFPWVIENDKDSDYLQNTLLAPQSSELPAQLPFMFELGTEELPVDDLNTALEQLAALVPQLLENLRLEHGEVKILGTPRRLVVSVNDLQTSQADRVVEFKGPPADRAFDADGNLTKAGEGFARSKGIDPDQLEIKDLDGGRYAVGTVKEVGKSTPELLTDSLPGLIASLKFNKPMRWNESGIAFSRPIRWLTAFLGRYPINFSYADIKSDTQTRGLRFVDPSNISITEPQDYYSALQKQGIILDQLERKQQIIAQVKALAEKVKGVIHDDPSLLDEVTNLVEQPTALLGNFDEKYLISLPAEVLISVMKKHQRYFPIFDDQGNLLPFFITIRNGDDKHAATVVDGNLQVILARFADAEFFIAADKERKLEDFIPDLAQLTFQKELGSMLDKTHRIEKLVNTLQKAFAMNEKESKDTLRAASLCKADLASNMVVEMTSLQGVMGKVYALESGEKPEVAEAILEHYLPRSTEDDIPKQKPGYVIGIADRLDTLAGLFSVGLAPTGTKDPFAQRRAALGLIQNLMGWDQDFDIKWGLEQASLNLPTPLSGDDLEACVEFVKGRLRGLLLDQGFRYDVVDAVLAKQGTNPAGVKRSVVSLSEWVERADWMEILPTFSRCVRITREIPQMHTVDTAFFVEEIERQLFESLEIAENAIAGVRLVDVVLNCFLPLMPLINAFFDTVLVMADDMKVRNNRLGLLQRIAALSKNSADMSYLEGF